MPEPGPLGIDPRLLEILRCPLEHHARLEVDEEASALVCTQCHNAYPVRDGLPIMLVDEADRRPPR
jgi:hypothetical protein